MARQWRFAQMWATVGAWSMLAGCAVLQAGSVPAGKGGSAAPGKSGPAAVAASPGKPPIMAGVGEDAASQKAQEILATELPTVDLDDVKFSEAIEKFRDMTKLQVHVNWNGVKAAGIAADTRVSVKLKNIVAAKVLEILIADAGGRGHIGYIVDGGVVRISTMEDLNRVTVKRIYDVSDLLLRRGNHPFWAGVVPATEIYPRGGAYAGDFGGVSRQSEGLFDEQTTRSQGGGGREQGIEGEMLTRAGLINELTNLITESVDPTSWRKSGGEIGSLREMGSKLIINQTLPAHKEIETLLAQLRKARDEDKVLTLRARWVQVEPDKSIVDAKEGQRTVTADSLKAANAVVAHENELTFFSGQIVHVVAGNVQAICPMAEPIVGDSSLGVRPVVTAVLWGAMLEATAVVLDDGQRAELKVRNIVSEPREMARKRVPMGIVLPEPHPAATTQPAGRTGRAVPLPGPEIELDMPNFTLQTFTTNLTVPLGKSVVVGATTIPRKGGGNDKLYLVVELTVGK